MIKLLKHHTSLEPVYIALSEDMRFHVLYEDASLGIHASIGAAVRSVANDYIFGISSDVNEWELLSEHSPSLNLRSACSI
ncbi:hypothetical protein ICN48_13140 [Polynucleobacter sp. JS-Safj-400b-B2]|uniref:hypothetical protein n=1 Tax=Polynucleobacter sp. JS-Safj-400b-B2 TaxID=2576921 RepID=UPI001C0CF5A0|nr:hypothetical protein [Polynucleobacter sp. JS-Safj-400b-B2]MBU3627170.1 hypothetical protein [Polynucleobacter sp. JS-Safj-400b-B2]